MKIKTQNLTGAALSYSVSLADGWEPGTADMAPWLFASRRIKFDADWSQGGPIIEREGIALCKSGYGWIASLDGPNEKEIKGDHHTPLVAAMRAYVASRLGDEVEVPDDLMKV